MAHVISCANQKGGSAKTTTVRNLGAALAGLGQHTLVVDTDPQGSLTIGCGVQAHSLEQTIYQVLLGSTNILDIILPVEANLDLVPANIHLAGAELDLVNRYRREDRMRRALEPALGRYDIILLDSPPSLGLLTVNTLAAAHYLLIPLSCEFYALIGLSLLLDTVAEMRREINPSLDVLGILPTRYDARTLHAQEVVNQVRIELGDRYRIFEPIRETVRFRETPIVGQSILEYAPKSQGAIGYRRAAEEVLACLDGQR